MAKGVKTVCNDCKFAKWDVGPSGRRTGDGWCQYKYIPAPLPMSMYFFAYAPMGGSITINAKERKECACREES